LVPDGEYEYGGGSSAGTDAADGSLLVFVSCCGFGFGGGGGGTVLLTFKSYIFISAAVATASREVG
jgi:hypothetical protein